MEKKIASGIMLMLLSTVLLSGTLMVGSVRAHALGATLSAWALIAPSIDGTVDPTEWAAADMISFTTSGGLLPGRTGTLYVMNDATNLYIAVAVPDTSPDVSDQCYFYFDNDHDGIFEKGDDSFRIQSVRPAAIPEYWDLHWNPDAPGWIEDFYPGYGVYGTIDGFGDAKNIEGVNYFEFSHPLDSTDDAYDFSLLQGDTVGFALGYYDNGESVGWFPGISGNPEDYGDITIASPPRTWTVDDDGPADFQTIQEAIDAANPGDTIHVIAGTYYEHLTINKALKLVGENSEATSIDGGGTGKAVLITANNVTVSGFTVQNSGSNYPEDSGIRVYSSNHSNITNNIVTDCLFGIGLDLSSHNTLVGNYVSENYYGILLVNSSDYNSIFANNIVSNWAGVAFEGASDNYVCHNNFINNEWPPFITPDSLSNTWDDGYPSGGNYWSDYAGVDEKAGPNQGQLGLDAIGDTPYVIDGDNQDRYPLFSPWIGRKPGIRAGDWARYGDFAIEWSSNDPGQHPPTDTQDWMNVTVQNTAGTNITFQVVMHYPTSPEYSTTGWQDVSTSDARGQMGVPLFISTNLSAGDTLYQTVFPVPINETIFCEYVGAIREVNHVAFERAFNYIAPDKYFNVSLSGCWDRAAGILTEYIIENIFVDETMNYVTSTSGSFRMVETNLWEAQTPPAITANLDIDPDTLDLRSKGKWITAYIQLPEGYNPADIDASTIMLNGTVAPVLDSKYDFVTNSSDYIVDSNGDGIPERMVKFDRAALQSWIYQSVGMQHEVSLTITGELTDGTQFEGAVTIFVFWEGHRSPCKR